MTDITNLDSILLEWGERVIGKIQQNMDTTGTNASGRTSQSLEAEITDTGLAITGRQWFRGVEEGRPGGGIPRNMTQIIRQWMTDKGIEGQFGQTESEKRSAAYLIGQFIKNHGTQLYRSGGRSDVYTNVFEDELPKLEEDMAYEIEQTILRNL